MEQQLERPQETSKPPKSYLLFAIISISLAVLFFFVTIFMYFDTKIQLKNQEKEIARMGKSLESVTKDVVFTKEYKKANSTVMIYTILQNLQHGAEGLVRTDDFKVEKLHLLFDPKDGSFKIKIDVKPTPQMSSHYKGGGVFDLPDDELRSKLTDLIELTKEFYIRSSNDSVPKWDDKSISITIDGFIGIGKTTSGKLKLVSEFNSIEMISPGA
ncbi:hypothetical protein [Cohnella sp.]|uniref:hypothetical protein n=1 Tax=Cohnella sp. TaxID=1883426 RepID=UPI0037047E6A